MNPVLSRQLLSIRQSAIPLSSEENDGNLLRGHDRGCVLLMTAAGTDFYPFVSVYDKMMERLRWNSLGMVLAGGDHNVDKEYGKESLQKAFDLGRSIC